jgi:hypothetical protein
MNRSLLILGVVIIVSTLLFGLIFVYLRKSQSGGNYRRVFTFPNQHRYSSRANRASARPSDRSEESEIRIEQVPRQLQKRLLLLLNGDRQTANRLLNASKLRNPGKSIQWYAEKVIFDLQRDRGRY